MRVAEPALAPIRPTTTPEAVAAMHWDVVVVGAGPAGALAAFLVADAGGRVLLVDRASLPRPKACGGCLSPLGLEMLEGAGLAGVVAGLGARTLRRVDLAAGGARAEIALAGGAAVSRSVLDGAIVSRAVARGAVLLAPVGARLGPVCADAREVMLTGGGGAPVVVRAGVVMAATGLDPWFHGRAQPTTSQPAANARIGLGTVVASQTAGPDDGTIEMTVSADGYVGRVRLEDDRMGIAAAIAPRAVRAAGGPAGAVARVLAAGGREPEPALGAARWFGTPALTRRPRRLYGERLLVIGDAAGYVEPFTGEGMGWALASAIGAAPVALAASRSTRGDLAGLHDWAHAHRRWLRRRQRACRIVAGLLRRPRATHVAIRALAAAPRLSAAVVARVHSSSCHDPFENPRALRAATPRPATASAQSRSVS